MLGMSYSSKLDLGCYSISVAKTASKKIETLIRSTKFLYPKFLCISINPPYGLTWNFVKMVRLVHLAAT